MAALTTVSLAVFMDGDMKNLRQLCHFRVSYKPSSMLCQYGGLTKIKRLKTPSPEGGEMKCPLSAESSYYAAFLCISAAAE